MFSASPGRGDTLDSFDPLTAVKVLYLTDSLSDLDGVGRYGMRLIAALESVEPDLQVQVLLARKHRPTSASIPTHWDVGVALPPDYFYYMSPLRYWVWRLLGVWRTWRAARGADLVHAIKDFPHSHVARLGARLAGVPCVATAHGTYSIEPLASPRHGASARADMHSFSRIIAVSEYTKARILEAMGAGFESKVSVVTNCVEASHYETERRLAGVPWEDQSFTLSIGELKERKGHHLALAAWCQLAGENPQLHHYVVGNVATEGSEDAYARQLHELISKYGLEGRVHFLGNVSEEQKVDLLQRAELFIHTPVTAADGGFEGFGIVYLEASAAGTACLGTLGSGAEDAVKHGVSGLLVDPELDSVVCGLRELLTDPDRRQSLGRGGQAWAAQANWKGNAVRVLELYREALSK